jgi:uncharacterized protein YbaR (Trm112 family)/ubiquinone/menaquinone biosynthesis C-methylase UbiE
MWHRLIDYLACPSCTGDLSVAPLGEPLMTGEESSQPDTWIEQGLLLCPRCRVMYPILDGLPVMLTYVTPAVRELQARFGAAVAARREQYRFASGAPEPGEEFVLHSFSTEWRDYAYDGVMWDLSYSDHEQRFLAECGAAALERARGGVFVEIGCGLGMSTVFAQKHLQGDAIGLDLGHAAGRAASKFTSNPRLHFVQASAFHPPLRPAVADLLYSHGVLHHTYSTERAVCSVMPLCKPGGTAYLWLYGPGSTKGSALRRLAWAAESVVRAPISRNLEHPMSKAFLGLCAVGYLAVNRYHCWRDPSVQRYDFRRAVHAARDRFTPLFAHRHEAAEVRRWFEEAWFENIEEVDWRTMPSANQDNYRRNTGVRGRRKAPAG